MNEIQSENLFVIHRGATRQVAAAGIPGQRAREGGEEHKAFREYSHLTSGRSPRGDRVDRNRGFRSTETAARRFQPEF